MATNEMITQLHSVSSATLSDIIMAVQGYVSPSVPGLSVQETLGQVLSLFQANTVLFNAGNPNGAVAGTTFQLCWDTTNTILYVCITTGSASTAIWKKSITLTAGTGVTINQTGNNIQISASASGLTWNNVITASATMVSNNGYVSGDAASLVTLTLPVTSSFGDIINIVGQSSNGWSIAQASGQQIIIGNNSSTLGAGGSVSSANRYDSVELVCVVTNTIWQARNGVQGNLTIV